MAEYLFSLLLTYKNVTAEIFNAYYTLRTGLRFLVSFAVGMVPRADTGKREVGGSELCHPGH